VAADGHALGDNERQSGSTVPVYRTVHAGYGLPEADLTEPSRLAEPDQARPVVSSSPLVPDHGASRGDLDTDLGRRGTGAERAERPQILDRPEVSSPKTCVGADRGGRHAREASTDADVSAVDRETDGVGRIAHIWKGCGSIPAGGFAGISIT
jgi:hypothetical protein